MKIQILHHSSTVESGAVQNWAHQRGHEIQDTHLHRGDVLPALETFDCLVVLGGEMSVNDEAEFPWLRGEKEFVARNIAADLPILGLCLGAQLIASASGATVRPNAQREIGWWPIQATAAGSKYFEGNPTVMQWHGETFDLPAGATLLAHNEACKHQAFSLGSRIFGLQFHPEATPEIVQTWLEDADALDNSRWVQSRETILNENHFASNHALLFRLLDEITDQVQ